jgi:hypothetical protein
VLGRSELLQAYGPQGLNNMTHSIEREWRKDIRVRTRGLENANKSGYKVDVHEIAPGVIYKDANVTVSAFPVSFPQKPCGWVGKLVQQSGSEEWFNASASA